MTQFGYTLMTEQSDPKSLVRQAIGAEAAGFDFAVASDHYTPWLESQGHAPYVWSVLGAVAQVTSRIGLMTYVTCPTMRYHPAVVAQKSATLQLLSDGRFTLGLGSGESLNEHVVGEAWPAVQERHAMLEEAIHLIRSLHSGELVDHRGEFFQVDSARIWDCPEGGVPIGVACGGHRAVTTFGPLADHLIATDPSSDLVDAWNRLPDKRAVGAGSRGIAQVPICWDPNAEEAAERAHRQFRWFAGGWSVNADLPTPAGFAAATAYIRPEDVREQIACGPDLDAVVDTIRPFWEAGFTDVALVQIGGDSTTRFLQEAAVPLLEKLRTAAA